MSFMEFYHQNAQEKQNYPDNEKRIKNCGCRVRHINFCTKIPYGQDYCPDNHDEIPRPTHIYPKSHTKEHQDSDVIIIVVRFLKKGHDVAFHHTMGRWSGLILLSPGRPTLWYRNIHRNIPARQWHCHASQDNPITHRHTGGGISGRNRGFLLHGNMPAVVLRWSGPASSRPCRDRGSRG
jgi:hypothetical protein